jgi:CRP/FNR family transcriptional regulator, cyclic AMP receptor protein
VSATIEAFYKATYIEKFAAGALIFAEGQPGDVMYIIREGEVSIEIRGAVVETLQAGDIFGEMSLIDHAPRSASAVARTDCIIVPIDRKRFSYLVQQTPYFALRIMQVMSARLRAAHNGASNLRPVDAVSR